MTPLPAVYLLLSSKRLHSWAAWWAQSGLTRLPPPMSEELDLLMATYWTWDMNQQQYDE